MNLKITSDIPENVFLEVNVLGNKKRIDCINKEVSFEIKKGTVLVEFNQIEIPKSKKWVRFVLFFLTFVFRGIINILLQNNDSYWYESIAPYIIHCDFSMEIFEDKHLFVKYKKSIFNNENRMWSYPDLLISPKTKHNIIYKKNTRVFLEKYEEFLKNLISVCLVAVLFFGFFLYQSIRLNIVFGIWFISCLIILIVLSSIFISIYQYKKMLILKRNFWRQVDG